jgi:hypothetical protein
MNDWELGKREIETEHLGPLSSISFLETTLGKISVGKAAGQGPARSNQLGLALVGFSLRRCVSVVVATSRGTSAGAQEREREGRGSRCLVEAGSGVCLLRTSPAGAQQPTISGRRS